MNAAMRRMGTSTGQSVSFSASSSSVIQRKASAASGKSGRLREDASMSAIVPGYAPCDRAMRAPSPRLQRPQAIQRLKLGNSALSAASTLERCSASKFASNSSSPRPPLLHSRLMIVLMSARASKKSDVRLRLTHLSHCGWEWGVDNIAFYDIAPPAGAAQPLISSIAISNGQVAVQWTNGGTLESTPTLVNPVWTTTGNSSGSFTESLSATGNKFYRVNK